MIDIDVDFQGMDEVMKALGQLPVHVQRKALVPATRAAAVVYQKAIKERAPVGRHRLTTNAKGKVLAPTKTGKIRRGGSLKRSVTIRYLKRSRRDQAVFTVGPRIFYAKFLEFGTPKMAARPFIRPAYDNSREAAQAAFKRKLLEAIPKATARGKGVR